MAGAPRLTRLVLTILAIFFAPSAYADQFTGRASVVDGDTIEIHGERIRIFGIDAPEGDQTCIDGGGKIYRCGQRAANAMDDLVRGKTVTCEQHDTDRYGRAVAVCKAGGIDVGGRMVEVGLAVAFTRYSDLYVGDEAKARAAKLGLWSGTFEMPWDYRERKRHENAQVVPNPKCPIKGNINKKGRRLYHVPGSRDYDGTKIDPSKGERWFCSEMEATAAGWTAAGRR